MLTVYLKFIKISKEMCNPKRINYKGKLENRKMFYPHGLMKTKKNLKEIYKTNELEEKATTRKIRAVQSKGNRKLTRNIDFYILYVIPEVHFKKI